MVIIFGMLPEESNDHCKALEKAGLWGGGEVEPTECGTPTQLMLFNADGKQIGESSGEQEY